MALDIDYLTQAKRFLEADAFGQDRPDGDIDKAIAYALVAIGESLSKLHDDGLYMRARRARRVQPIVAHPQTEEEWEQWRVNNR